MKSRVGASVGCLAAIALLLMASCASWKKTVPTLSHADTYAWMTAKMTMDLSAPGMELNGVTGSLRMRRDSAIWLSASTMGMESVRAMMTNDTVFVINRFEQTYLAEPLAEVAEKLQLPLTLQECQSLLLGKGDTDHVELRFGPYTAKVRYSDIHWDEPQSFPMKINKKYTRIKI